MHVSSVGGYCRELAGDAQLSSGSFLEASEAGLGRCRPRVVQSILRAALAQGPLEPLCMGQFNCWDAFQPLESNGRGIKQEL